MKLLLASLLLVLPLTARAKRPELDAVFWGNITHSNASSPLRPLFLGEFTVTAWLNGVKIAELALPPSAPPGASRYVLKVPLDDGAEPRLPATARFEERLTIMVLKCAEDGAAARAFNSGAASVALGRLLRGGACRITMPEIGGRNFFPKKSSCSAARMQKSRSTRATGRESWDPGSFTFYLTPSP